jgi:DNA polymerase-3 subunit delta
MQSLDSELAKICAYAGQGATLTRAHVDAVAIPKTEARVFDISKCILSGNTQRAFEILDSLFYLRESPIAILATLTSAYADLYRARLAKDEGKSAAECAELFGYKNLAFRINNAYGARVSANALRKSLASLLDCDLKMKSTGADDKILLEKAVAELFLYRGLD